MKHPLSHYVKQAHKTAVEKGWWENRTPFTPAVKKMLIVSELCEAIEELRNGRGLGEIWYGEGNKPEGFPIEIADAFIRAADLVGALSDDKDSLIVSIPCTANHWHMQVSDGESATAYILDITRQLLSGTDYRVACLQFMVDLERLCCAAEIDLGEAIEIKSAFNATREHRHGGRAM